MASKASKVFPEQAYGVDIDPMFISEATKLAADEHIANVRFELGNIDGLKYEGGTFDLSFCRLVLNFLHKSSLLWSLSSL